MLRKLTSLEFFWYLDRIVLLIIPPFYRILRNVATPDSEEVEVVALVLHAPDALVISEAIFLHLIFLEVLEETVVLLRCDWPETPSSPPSVIFGVGHGGFHEIGLCILKREPAVSFVGRASGLSNLDFVLVLLFVTKIIFIIGFSIPLRQLRGSPRFQVIAFWGM